MNGGAHVQGGMQGVAVGMGESVGLGGVGGTRPGARYVPCPGMMGANGDVAEVAAVGGSLDVGRVMQSQQQQPQLGQAFAAKASSAVVGFGLGGPSVDASTGSGSHDATAADGQDYPSAQLLASGTDTDPTLIQDLAYPDATFAEDVKMFVDGLVEEGKDKTWEQVRPL